MATKRKALKATTMLAPPGASSACATARMVAERAGVSIATVSFVLSNRPGQVISAPVRKRVIAAAKALNYAPSAAAVSLATRRSKNVAVVFYQSDHLITNPFYSFVVQGAIKEAGLREYNILFSFMHEVYKDASALPKMIREKNAEGVLFMQSVSPALVRDLKALGLAVVGVDSSPHVPELDTVEIDNTRGARLACVHLVELGHREIVMLTSRTKIHSLSERQVGFLAECKARGLGTKARELIVKCERLDFYSGYERAKELLTARPLITGIFCANDELAAGVLRAARELGRTVPRSLSVIGFDDILLGQYVDPPLSTIGFDKEAMGKAAMARLLDRVGKKDVSVLKQVLPVELLVRGSSGRLKKGRARDA